VNKEIRREKGEMSGYQWVIASGTVEKHGDGRGGAREGPTAYGSRKEGSERKVASALMA